MIQVLLLILKIIGITILVILGLLLLVLTLVLFVPVFYRIHIVHNSQETKVKARASFLCPLVLVTFQYLKKISYKVRILGIALLDSDRPKKEKQPKKKKVTKKKTKKETGKSQQAAEEEEFWSPLEQPGKPPVYEQSVEQAALDVSENEPDSQQESEQEKIGFFEKVRSKIQKIRETINNIRIKIKNIVCNTWAKIKKILRQKEEVQRILAKPETKEALAFAWDKLKRIVKHVLPRKIKGYLAYGADNPATTGQVLGILSVVYAKTGQLLEIRPNFEEKQLECDVVLKGRVQVFTLLVIAVKVFLNKELRQLVEEVKRLKEIE